MIIKDSMVLIHPAKLTLLETSCDFFKDVAIPKLVYEEVVGSGDIHPDVMLISGLVKKNKIKIINVRSKKLIKKANQFNIQRGEAECMALYWQEKSKLLATDDDNVRKKSVLLNVNAIGTPAIIIKLYKENHIDRKKLEGSISTLRKIGWFSGGLLDKILLEGLK